MNGQQFTERGIFGLQVTNVLPGDPIQYLTVPNGVGNSFGVSHLYEFTFTLVAAGLWASAARARKRRSTA